MVAAVWPGEGAEIPKGEKDQSSLHLTIAEGSSRGLWVCGCNRCYT